MSPTQVVWVSAACGFFFDRPLSGVQGCRDSISVHEISMRPALRDHGDGLRAAPGRAYLNRDIYTARLSIRPHLVGNTLVVAQDTLQRLRGRSVVGFIPLFLKPREFQELGFH